MRRFRWHSLIPGRRRVLALAALVLAGLTASVSRAQPLSAGVFQFTTTNQIVSERETEATLDNSVGQSIRGVRITVTRTNGVSGRVMVDFATQDGTALDGNHYTATNGTLFFNDFQMSASFVVPTIDNVAPDMSRDFTVVLSNPQLAPSESTSITPPTLNPELATNTITILDMDSDPITALDASAIFNFEKKTFRVSESVAGGVARIAVRLTGFTDGAAQVDYRIRPNNNLLEAGSDYATRNADYTNVTGTLKFSGNGVQEFEIPIVNDDLVEFNEDLQLQLFNPGSASAQPVLGYVSSATLTILSDDPPAGSLDTTHNMDGSPFTSPPTNAAPGANGAVYAVAAQTDGKMVFGGSFTSFNTTPRSRIARMNTDGQLDTTFQSGNGANGFVSSISVDETNRIIIGGGFTSYNGIQRNGIARLNPDGSLDTTFTPGQGANGTVWAVANAGGNKVLIAGEFTTVGGHARAYVARLNPDGSVDTTFDPGDSVDGPVYALGLKGSIFIDATAAGDDKEDRRTFDVGANSGVLIIDYQFYSVPDFLRVYYDGVKIFDTGSTNGGAHVVIPFGPGNSTDITIVVNEGGGQFGTVWDYTARIDPASTEVLIGGDFTSIGGVPRNRIARLQSDGTLDPGFDPGPGANDVVNALAVQRDGRVLVSGAFTQMAGHDRRGVARLNADGSFDATFDPGTGADDVVYSLNALRSVTAGGSAPAVTNIIIAGSFNSFNGTRRAGLARLYADGSLDTGFMDTAYNQFAGVPNMVTNSDVDTRNYIFATAIQTDGNIVIGGGFSRVGGGSGRDVTRPRRNIARVIGGSTPGPGNIQFPFDEYTGDENSSLFITLARTNGNLGPGAATFAPVPLPPGPGAAQPGVDYSFNPSFGLPTWVRRGAQVSDAYFGLNTLTPPGADDVFIDLPDNSIRDGNRSLDLKLSNPKGFDCLFLGGENIAVGTALGRPTARLTIVDDDFSPGVLGFSLPAYFVNESVLNAVITVTRTNGSDGLVRVKYATSDGPPPDGATAGLDYTARNGTLTFNDGQISQNIFIPIAADGFDDSLVEPDETVNLRLFSVSGGATLGLTNTVLTIIDNDFPAGRLNFSSLTFSTNESAGFARLTVTRTGGSEGTLSVQFATTNDTALAGTDYTPMTGTLTWNDGDTATKTIAVPLLDNNLINPDKTVILGLFGATLNGLSNPQVLGSRPSTTLTIVNDDFSGAVRFSATNYLVNENGGLASIAVVRTNGSAEAVSVDFSAIPQSGTVDGRDFIATSGTLVFGPGQLSKSFTVTILNNTNADGPRSIALLLGNASPTSALGNPSTATLNLIDDESLPEPPGSVNTSYVAAGLNGAVNALALQSDGKLVVGGEFTEANGILRNRIARFNTNGTLDGGFSLAATNAGTDAAVRTLIRQTDGRIVIGGDFGTVNGLSRSHLARLNLDGSLDNAFDPGSGANGPVLALAESGGSTGLGGGGPRKLLVGGGFTVINAATRNSIARLNDNGTVDGSFAAGLEVNGLVYAIAVQPDGRVFIGGDFTSINGIGRNRVARLSVDGSLDLSFDPGAGANAAVRALAVQLDGRLLIGGSFTNFNGVALNRFARLNANGTLDPTFTPGVGANDTVTAITLQDDTQIILGGLFTRCSGVTRNYLTRLNNDGTVDPTINFGLGANNYVSATAVQTDGKIIIGGGFTEYDGVPRRRVARIYGRSVAGSGKFEFTTSIFQANENSTNALITVRRRGGAGGAPGNITVDAVASDGQYPNGATNGVHFIGGTNALVFPPGEVLQSFFIPLIDDFQINPDRTNELTLGNIRPPDSAALGSKAAAKLVIVNDDSAVSFASATYRCDENAIDGVATIRVVRTGSTVGGATAEFRTTTNGTAQPGVHYTPVTNALVFQPGEMFKNVTIPVLNDTAKEWDRTVTMGLFNVVGALSLAPAQATLTIVEDDLGPGQIAFTASSYTVAENGVNAIITLMRTNGHSQTVSVNYYTRDGTANAPLDYAASFGPVSFGDGETNKEISVPIVDDVVVEDAETFQVVLTNATSGATIAGATNVTVTIVDNDVGLTFAPAFYVVNEGSGSVTLTVSRSNGSNGVATVNYATINGTATAGDDYTATNGMLTFANGETTKSFTIPILDDTLVEADEIFNVRLSNPVGGVLVNSNAVVMIADNDPGVGFGQASYTVDEGGTNLVITVVRSNANSGVVSVTCATSSGSATAGADFSPVNTVLTFVNGETMKTVTVGITNDTLVEGDETFQVTLSNPTIGAQVVGVNPVTVTIVDNDAGFKFSRAAYTIWESGGQTNITVLRTGITNSTVGVDYSTGDDTATSGSDYVTASGTLTFTNGETVKSFPVQVNEDTLIEGDETVLLRLLNPTGQASVVSPGLATLTILDNDGSRIVAAGARLIANANDNDAIDPDEIVTVLFALRNAGGGDTTNLVATLLATGGVTAPSGLTNYGALASGGGSVSRPFTFTARGTNGGTVVATFALRDGPMNLGQTAFTFPLGSTTATFSNTANIVINDLDRATPYPATIAVAGFDNYHVNKVTVKLDGLSHTAPGDIDALVVGPTGTNVIVLSDIGGTNPVSNVTLTFDDAGNSLTNPIITSGLYKPTNYLFGDFFPAPAPSSPYGATLSGFNNLNPNGDWSLYVADDMWLDTGNITRGWLLGISAPRLIPAAADLAVTMTAAPDPVVAISNLTYMITITNHGPSTANGVVLTNVLPPGAVITAVSRSQGNFAGDSSQLSWNVGTLAVGTNGVPAGATATISVRPTVVGTAVCTASASAVEADPNPGNNTVIAATTVINVTADLALGMMAAPNPVFVGNDLTYTLMVTNLGPATATDVAVTNTLPSGVSFVSASPSGYTQAGRVVAFTNLGNLGSGSILSAAITVHPNVGGTLTGTATCSSGVTDPLKGNNTKSVTTVVEGLIVSRVGNTVVLAWPVSAASYTLERTASLTPPIVWTPVITPPVTNGQISVTVAIGPGSEFFRLKAQAH